MRDQKREGSPSRIVHQARHHLQKHLALGLNPSHRSCISPLQEKKATSDPSDNHPVMLASRKICLSCFNTSGILMLHEEEKRHAWSGETRSSSFTMGNVRVGERGRNYVRQCEDSKSVRRSREEI
jgi:hypothetical protein